MGGNAIKKVKVERISKTIYLEIIQEITDILNQLPIRFDFTRETPGKIDFGDVDVLIDTSYGLAQSVESVVNLIHEKFQTVELAISGYVYSFAYEKDGVYYQVDFILVCCLEMAKLYFSYGDTGAIIGRYTAFHGLFFSEDGLYVKVKACHLFNMKYPQNENILKEMVLCSNPREVCEFLVLDYDKWLQGFASVEELFEWIISSRFYSREFYCFLKGEHRRRLRNLRAFYHKFLEYIQVDLEKVDDLELKFNLTLEAELSNMMLAIQAFHKVEEFEAVEEAYTLRYRRKEKFNCNVFLNNGVEHHQLRGVMNDFERSKNKSEEENFESWLDSHDETEVAQEISEWILERRKDLVEPSENTQYIL